ncbi:MAG: phosphate acetyltransferase [Candidatus Omnitrophica bacterium]|nr:phosphate acetyltransferase [Candidatus Omnitrophota bacterium]MBU1869813.1 phosphate acetyltransferase [Candidatus Omnitrophota bacterium]
MDTISKIRDLARSELKSIVLPEYDDSRVVEAVRFIEKEGLAKVTLMTPDKVDESQRKRYIDEYYQMHNSKEVDLGVVQELFNRDTLYYSAMMTREGKFDGLVAGASHTTPEMARAAIRCIGIDDRITIVSSCFIMVAPNCPYGENGTFVFADCGIIPEPNGRQLGCIALSAAELAEKVLGFKARIAFLSYSTKGSARTKSAEKIAEGLAQLKEMSPDILADGELQVDAAIVPEVAKIKYPESPIGGKANVLIFPNLEAGNIGYKLSQRLSGARAVGPLLLGLKKPASDLSRGCFVEDIVDCVAATAIRAQ